MAESSAVRTRAGFAVIVMAAWNSASVVGVKVVRAASLLDEAVGIGAAVLVLYNRIESQRDAGVKSSNIINCRR